MDHLRYLVYQKSAAAAAAASSWMKKCSFSNIQSVFLPASTGYVNCQSSVAFVAVHEFLKKETIMCHFLLQVQSLNLTLEFRTEVGGGLKLSCKCSTVTSSYLYIRFIIFLFFFSLFISQCQPDIRLGTMLSF